MSRPGGSLSPWRWRARSRSAGARARPPPWRRPRRGRRAHRPRVPTRYDQYVALGDSLHGRALVPPTDTTTICLRSAVNYPALVAEAMSGTVLTDVSCSGASTRNTTEPADRSHRLGAAPARCAAGDHRPGDDRPRRQRRPAVRGRPRPVRAVAATDPAGPCRDSFASRGGGRLATTFADITEHVARGGARRARAVAPRPRPRRRLPADHPRQRHLRPAAAGHGRLPLRPWHQRAPDRGGPRGGGAGRRRVRRRLGAHRRTRHLRRRPLDQRPRHQCVDGPGLPPACSRWSSSMVARLVLETPGAEAGRVGTSVGRVGTSRPSSPDFSRRRPSQLSTRPTELSTRRSAGVVDHAAIDDREGRGHRPQRDGSPDVSVWSRSRSSGSRSSSTRSPREPGRTVGCPSTEAASASRTVSACSPCHGSRSSALRCTRRPAPATDRVGDTGASDPSASSTPSSSIQRNAKHRSGSLTPDPLRSRRGRRAGGRLDAGARTPAPPSGARPRDAPSGRARRTCARRCRRTPPAPPRTAASPIAGGHLQPPRGARARSSRSSAPERFG